MGVGRKNIFIRYYVQEKVEQLKKIKIEISEEEFEKLIDKFSEMRLGTLELIHEIDEEFKKIVAEYYEQKDLMKSLMEKIEANKELQDLPLEYSGITLNAQDVDLMRIEDSKTPEELEYALNTAANRQTLIENFRLTDKEFLEARKKSYELYQDTLEDTTTEIKDPTIKIRKKIQYLKDSGELTEEEQEKLSSILSESPDTGEMVKKITEQFGEEKAHRMYEVIRECTPVEKEGIKSTTPDASATLLEEIKKNYNSITIDEESKYGAVALQDGTFDFRHLKKMLEFAQGLGKEVRLNALVFYMDCPEELYSLDKTEENKKAVKETVARYIDETTRFIAEGGYSSTVRSIDVFNELPNRFAMSGEKKYQYRGDIPQTLGPDGKVPDNIKSGWSKHLDVEDLCDVISVARKNLPDTDFMYNDDNLTDYNKLEVTKDIITRIQKYEQEHGVKLIDSIGTQMHVDNTVTEEQIAFMFRELSKFGLPIEVTELDLAMTHGVEGLTAEEIEVLRQMKMNEILSCIEELSKECNIRGVTIWSKTDSQNFRVKLANEQLIAEGREQIDSLHGGYFTENMEPKAKQFTKSYNYHTHTNRCGHASDVEDQEYVDSAREAGITTLGFSDHIPNTDVEYEEEDERMHISETDEYLSSIEELREANPDMEILSGFEAEYDPAKAEYLSEMRAKVDYMILGQHFVKDGLSKTNPHTVNYPLEYAESVCRGIETGLFDIVAHPDLFFREREALQTEEEKNEFDKNAREASRMICEAAREMGIPVELNLAGLGKSENYPNKIFWEVASETKAKVVVSSDAHDPKQLKSMKEDRQRAYEKIGDLPLNEVGRDYNPNKARARNKKLQSALAMTATGAISYETYIILQLIEKISSSKDQQDIPQLCDSITSKMEQLITNEDINVKITKITSEEEMTRLKKQLQSKHFKETLKNRREMLLRARESVKRAKTSCKTKQELISFVRLDMESTRKKKKNLPKDMTSMLIETPEVEKTATQPVAEKPKVLIKPNNNSNKGYIETLSLYTSIIAVSVIIILIIMILFV